MEGDDHKMITQKSFSGSARSVLQPSELVTFTIARLLLRMSTEQPKQVERLTIRLPDDFHHHVRDGPQTAAILQHAARRFGRCLIMPNLKPPVTTTSLALQYKQHILNSMTSSHNHKFTPLMTLYLTDQTTPEQVQEAHQAGIVGCKYYPAGATTNSEFGVTDIRHCYATLQRMSDLGMMLCIHSEVTHADIFEREPLFIDEIMKPLVQQFPQLKITMEHISTQEAVDYVLQAPDTVKATITCHHLLYNRNRKYKRDILCIVVSVTFSLDLSQYVF